MTQTMRRINPTAPQRTIEGAAELAADLLLESGDGGFVVGVALEMERVAELGKQDVGFRLRLGDGDAGLRRPTRANMCPHWRTFSGMTGMK